MPTLCGALRTFPICGSSGSFPKLSGRAGRPPCARPGWAETPGWASFATRSPFRPNNLGLSSVRLLGVEQTREFGTVLHVGGADLMDGTPIFDIKPYIPYGDCHPDATGGFTDTAGDFLLNVSFPPALLSLLPEDKRDAAIGVLSHDPRPSYQRSPERVYGLSFAGYDIRFTVEENILTVREVLKK